MIPLVTSPVFAQEEEQEAQIEIEAGIASSDNGTSSAIAAFPDKSVWFRVFNTNDDNATYCWVDENEEPRCKVVKVEED